MGDVIKVKFGEKPIKEYTFSELLELANTDPDACYELVTNPVAEPDELLQFTADSAMQTQFGIIVGYCLAHKGSGINMLFDFLNELRVQDMYVKD